MSDYVFAGVTCHVLDEPFLSAVLELNDDYCLNSAKEDGENDLATISGSNGPCTDELQVLAQAFLFHGDHGSLGGEYSGYDFCSHAGKYHESMVSENFELVVPVSTNDEQMQADIKRAREYMRIRESCRKELRAGYTPLVKRGMPAIEAAFEGELGDMLSEEHVIEHVLEQIGFDEIDEVKVREYLQLFLEK